MNRIVLLFALIVWSSGSGAHGTADNHLQIMIVDDHVKMNITVDMRVLAVVDSDNDGYASLAELTEYRNRLKAWVAKSIDVTDQDNSAGAVVFEDVTSDLDIAREQGDRVDHARIVQTLQFDEVPKELRLNLGALASLVPELRVMIIDASTGFRYRMLDPTQPQSVPMPNGGKG